MFGEIHHPKHPLTYCIASLLSVRPEAFNVNCVFIHGGMWILFVDMCFLCGELLLLACYCRSVHVLTSCLSGFWKHFSGKQLYKLFVLKRRSLKLSIHTFFSFTLKWQGQVPCSCRIYSSSKLLWCNLNKGCWVCWDSICIHSHCYGSFVLENINCAEARWTY